MSTLEPISCKLLIYTSLLLYNITVPAYRFIKKIGSQISNCLSAL